MSENEDNVIPVETLEDFYHYMCKYERHAFSHVTPEKAFLFGMKRKLPLEWKDSFKRFYDPEFREYCRLKKKYEPAAPEPPLKKGRSDPPPEFWDS